MSSKTLNLVTCALMLAGCELDQDTRTDSNAFAAVNNAPVAEVVDEPKEIGEYVLLMMRIVNTDASETKKIAIVRAIVNVAMDIFDNQEARKQFVVMVAIESHFNEGAKSPVGALGLTQIMPQYAKEFGAACGLKDIREADFTYPDVNLVLGACRFKALLDAFNGQPVPALVAYNAGLASNQLKQLKALRGITNQETSGYVIKWVYLKDKADLNLRTSDERSDRSEPVSSPKNP